MKSPRWSLPVVAWSAIRVAGLLLASGASVYPQVDNDVEYHYYLWANLVLNHGLLPWKNFGVEYPPGVLPLMILPGSVKVYELEFFLLALIADACVAYVLFRTTASTVAVWSWILLPLLLGPVLWFRLDIFVAAGIAGFVVAVERGRWAVAGICIAAASMLKLWPVALLVLVLPIVPRAGLWRIVRSAAITSLVVTLPVLLWGGGTGLWQMVRTQAGRGLEIESVWAAPSVVAHGLGVGPPVSSGEGSPVVVLPHLWVTLADLLLPLLLIVLAVHVWRARRPSPPSVRWVVATACALVLIGAPVLSPQYVTWGVAAALVGVEALAATRRQVNLLLAASAGLAATTQWVYPYAYLQIPSSAADPQAAVILHALAVVTWVFVVLGLARRRRGEFRGSRSAARVVAGSLTLYDNVL